MKHILAFLIVLLSYSNANGQFVLSEKKGKYGVNSSEGVKLLKPKFDTVVFFTDSLKHLVAAKEQEGYVIYNLSGKAKRIEYEHQIISVKDDKYGINGRQYIFALDNFGTQHYFYTEGYWQTFGYPTSSLRVAEGLNSKYAICSPDSCYTDYSFEYLEKSYYKHFFTVYTDSGKMAIDSLGHLIYPYAFEYYRPNYYNEKAFVVHRDERTKWGLMSVDGSAYIPMQEMTNGESVFSMDGDSYADIVNDFMEFDENGKKGLRSWKNELVLPAEYDRFYHSSDGFYYCYRNDSVVGIYSDSTKWLKTFENNEEFLVEKNGYILFTKGEELFFLDYGTKKELQGIDITFPEFEHSEDKNYFYLVARSKFGMIDSAGKIIVPFIHETFAGLFTSTESDFYIFSEDSINLKLIDQYGKVWLEGNYERISTVCHMRDYYLEIQKDGKQALAMIDEKKQELVWLTDFLYYDISCGSADTPKYNKDLIIEGQLKFRGPKKQIHRDINLDLRKPK